MATYVNDLRLKEIATGDEAGTWGTSTNTNLELIAEAFSFGTEAITTNADTHTTTIADGSTDPGRSIFLKYTGTLDSACTITIGPNTVSKLWFIENATSGSQNIIIKQGSGATITVPNGQVKAIYSDGAGSGGAMVDAFQDLSVPDLFVDDDLTVGDDLTFTSDSAVITFGADGDTTLTHTDGSGLTLNSTNKIMFNDASQFIQGSSATVLALGATDEIDLTATAIDVNGTMDVSGALTGTTATLTTADNSTQLTLKSTDDDANAGPVFDLVRDSASPADSDVLGRIRFRADNDAGEETTMVYLQTYLHDASDGSEDGGLDLFARLAGSLTRRITINSSGEICFNEDSNDIDFRVESDGNANMLFVDAGNNSVGIGESNPNSYGTLAVTGTGAIGNFNASSGAATIQLYENGAGRFGITTPNGSAGANFTLAGSTHLTIDSNGSLGIGTTSPQTSTSGLHVVHDATEGTPSFPLGEVIIAQRNFNSAQGCHIGIIGGTAGDAAINFGDKDDADIGRITYNNGDNSMRFLTNTSEAMRISSSNTVGIGRTPASTVMLDITENDSATDLIIGLSAGTGGRAQIRSVAQSDSTSSALSFQVMTGSSTSEAVRITSLGRLGINRTSPNGLLHLQSDSGSDAELYIQTSAASDGSTICFGDNSSSTVGQIQYIHSSNAMAFRVTGAEAARFLTDGRLILGSTTGVASGTPADGRLEIVAAASNNCINTQVLTAGFGAFVSTGPTTSGGNTYSFAAMVNGSGSLVGSIVVSHGSTAYNTSSDYRLKENVTELTNATNRLKQLQPKRFNFIEVPDATIDGFLAHEVSDIVPEAVSGTKDAVDADGNPEYQGIDQSKLVPLLVATIQELEARITALEEK